MADFIVEAHYPDRAWSRHPDGWIPIVHDNSRRYCEGYMARIAEQSPRPAYRVRRSSDGAIVAQCPASDEPQIGMVAGWATDEQCIRGAVKALEMARRSRRGGEPDPRIAAALAVLEGETAARPTRSNGPWGNPDECPDFGYITRRGTHAFCRCGAYQMVDPAHAGPFERTARTWLMVHGWSHEEGKVPDEGWHCPRCTEAAP